MASVETLIRLAVGLVAGTGLTFAGAYAAEASLHGAGTWSTAVQALALPIATLADATGLPDTPAASWLQVGGGFVLWTGIGYLAGARLLRRRAT